jgi:hypothetical protein
MERDYVKEEMLNNLLATGAVLAALEVGRANGVDINGIQPVYVNSEVTNQITLQLGFLHSPYRITVERITTPR